MGGSSSKAPANTSQEKAQAEIAGQRWRRYMEVYAPFQEVALGDVMGDSSANRVTRWAGGQSNADSAQVLAGQGGYGDPSSQNAQAAMMNPQRAAILAKTAADQAGLGRRQKIRGLETGVAIGTGQAKEAQLAFSDLAGQSLENSLKTQKAAFNARSDRADMYGSAAGAAIRGGEAMYDYYKGNG